MYPTIRAAIVALLLLVVPTAAFAQKGGGHASGHKSGGSGSSQPVHVKSYTKKDGTHVEEHDRKAAETKGNTANPSTSPAPKATAAPIRMAVDPVTGVKTFTNEPAPVLPSRGLTTFGSVVLPRTTPSKAIATSLVGPRPATTGDSVSSAPVARGANGRIARSAAAKHAFEVQTGYPHGRPGYVIDHIKPLACGGSDAPSNMQWQTTVAAKAKDKVEQGDHDTRMAVLGG
jgi:hypothetical protein